MELPNELKRLIEKYKALYNIVGSDDEILKRVIPQLEDEDIIQLYDELCKSEAIHTIKSGQRPNFEKYREELLDYLDDNTVKSEIIKREQSQSSKSDLQQRNYTYISEFATNLDNKPDKIKIIKTFYKKIHQLENQRDSLNIDNAFASIELSIHLYECILHIHESMDIDLGLYREFNAKKKYKLKNYIDFKKIKNRMIQKQNNEKQRLAQVLYVQQITTNIDRLNKQLEKIKLIKEKKAESEEYR